MLTAAGQPMKVVGEVLGHSTVAFTADVYVTVADELAEAAASAIEAFVPRKGKIVSDCDSNVPASDGNDH
jgi:hypothetical protein